MRYVFGLIFEELYNKYWGIKITLGSLMLLFPSLYNLLNWWWWNTSTIYPLIKAIQNKRSWVPCRIATSTLKNRNNLVTGSRWRCSHFPLLIPGKLSNGDPRQRGGLISRVQLLFLCPKKLTKEGGILHNFSGWRCCGRPYTANVCLYIR
jgi:hypothetical protein